MDSFCVFNIGEQRVGINMRHVREIIEHSAVECVPVPLAPGFLRGLFNLRGQIMPLLDLTQFVGAGPSPLRAGDRALIVERGDFRFATTGQRIDTVNVDASALKPVADAALYPALDAAATSERGDFHVIHLDRLEACLAQSLKFNELAA
jgi:purine-binding chemotaxis protein CheW